MNKTKNAIIPYKMFIIGLTKQNCVQLASFLYGGSFNDFDILFFFFDQYLYFSAFCRIIGYMGGIEGAYIF